MRTVECGSFGGTQDWPGRGFIYYEQGKHELAVRYIEECIQMLELSRTHQKVIWAELTLAIILTRIDENDVDVEALNGSIQTNELWFFNGWLKRLLAENLMNKGTRYAHEVEDLLQSAIEEDTKNRIMWHLASDHALYGE